MRQNLSKGDGTRQGSGELAGVRLPETGPKVAVSLLTGGADRPYVLGLGPALMSRVAYLDLIASDDLESPQFHGKAGINFLNLRGSQRTDVSFVKKIFRVAMYYARLIRYVSSAKPRIFHILWNNKFELFDRTLLMLYYRLLGKRVVLTVHNVNAGRRDSRDSRINRLTLRIQYRLTDHLFVHTEKMKQELMQEFGVESARITVIPFGINNAVPNTSLTPAEAKKRLGLHESEKAILFFGNITPYKGIEYLVAAFKVLLSREPGYRLIIAGKPDNCEMYWKTIRTETQECVERGTVLLRADFIPDSETELYFKAADVLVLPYRHVYQSGVLFLGYSFGLPVVAADVGSLKDAIVEGKTGWLVKPEDSVGLATAIEQYFASELYAGLADHRLEIRDYAAQRHSWDIVGEMTTSVYARLLRMPDQDPSRNRDLSNPSLSAKAPS
jgi:D-inositol-3-phosphate glycosyltransferase